MNIFVKKTADFVNISKYYHKNVDKFDHKNILLYDVYLVSVPIND